MTELEKEFGELNDDASKSDSDNDLGWEHNLIYIIIVVISLIFLLPVIYWGMFIFELLH